MGQGACAGYQQQRGGGHRRRDNIKTSTIVDVDYGQQTDTPPPGVARREARRPQTKRGLNAEKVWEAGCPEKQL